MRTEVGTVQRIGIDPEQCLALEMAVHGPHGVQFCVGLEHAGFQLEDAKAPPLLEGFCQADHCFGATDFAPRVKPRSPRPRSSAMRLSARIALIVGGKAVEQIRRELHALAHRTAE